MFLLSLLFKVFQRRVDDSVDFFRGWNDYVRGFGNATGNLWLGMTIRKASFQSYLKRVYLGISAEHRCKHALTVQNKVTINT